MGETGSLSGIITDHLGHPVPSAHVMCDGGDWDLESAEVTTDEMGVYSISALSAGSLDVEVVTDHDKPGVKGTILVIAGQDTLWSPSLPAPLAILGRAVSPAGRPLEGFHVRGRAQTGDGPMAVFQVNVKADGSFEAPNCLNAAYALSLMLPGHWMMTSYPQLPCAAESWTPKASRSRFD